MLPIIIKGMKGPKALEVVQLKASSGVNEPTNIP